MRCILTVHILLSGWLDPVFGGIVGVILYNNIAKKPLVYVFIILFFFLAIPICAGEDFFVAPLGEAAGFGWDGLSYGGGFTLGCGDGAAIGIRCLYAQDSYNFIAMELQCFLRMYFSLNANTGPFVQISAGPVIYADTIPALSGYGTISAGLGAGWRFPVGKHWYIEPAIRAGYPYLIGG